MDTPNNPDVDPRATMDKSISSDVSSTRSSRGQLSSKDKAKDSSKGKSKEVPANQKPTKKSTKKNKDKSKLKHYPDKLIDLLEHIKDKEVKPTKDEHGKLLNKPVVLLLKGELNQFNNLDQAENLDFVAKLAKKVLKTDNDTLDHKEWREVLKIVLKEDNDDSMDVNKLRIFFLKLSLMDPIQHFSIEPSGLPTQTPLLHAWTPTYVTLGAPWNESSKRSALFKYRSNDPEWNFDAAITWFGIEKAEKVQDIAHKVMEKPKLQTTKPFIDLDIGQGPPFDKNEFASFSQEDQFKSMLKELKKKHGVKGNSNPDLKHVLTSLFEELRSEKPPSNLSLLKVVCLRMAKTHPSTLGISFPAKKTMLNALWLASYMALGAHWEETCLSMSDILSKPPKRTKPEKQDESSKDNSMKSKEHGSETESDASTPPKETPPIPKIVAASKSTPDDTSTVGSKPDSR